MPRLGFLAGKAGKTTKAGRVPRKIKVLSKKDPTPPNSKKNAAEGPSLFRRMSSAFSGKPSRSQYEHSRNQGQAAADRADHGWHSPQLRDSTNGSRPGTRNQHSAGASSLSPAVGRLSYHDDVEKERKGQQSAWPGATPVQGPRAEQQQYVEMRRASNSDQGQNLLARNRSRPDSLIDRRGRSLRGRSPQQLQIGVRRGHSEEPSSRHHGQAGSPLRYSQSAARLEPDHGSIHNLSPQRGNHRVRGQDRLYGREQSPSGQHRPSSNNRNGQGHRHSKSESAVPPIAHYPPDLERGQSGRRWKPPSFIVEAGKDAGKALTEEALAHLVHTAVDQAKGWYQRSASNDSARTNRKSEGNNSDHPAPKETDNVAAAPSLEEPSNELHENSGRLGRQSGYSPNDSELRDITRNMDPSLESSSLASPSPASPSLPSRPILSVSREQFNVSSGDDIIFPRRFGMYPNVKVSWFDGFESYSDKYLCFTSWNTRTSRGVLTFLPQTSVTVGKENATTHFANTYPSLWVDPDYRQHAGYKIQMDEKWQWGQLGEFGERFVVYQPRRFQGLYNTSFTSALWQQSSDHADALTRFEVIK